MLDKSDFNNSLSSFFRLKKVQAILENPAMAEEIKFHSDSFSASAEEPKMLVSFCEDFQINIVIKAVALD